MSGKTSEDKSLPATKKKLQESRKKGQVASCKEFVTAAGSTAVLGYVALRGPNLVINLSGLLAEAGTQVNRPWDQALTLMLDHSEWAAAEFLLPMLGLLIAFVCVSGVVGHGGLVFSSDPLKPKMERIDPIAGLKRLFQMRNVIEALKTLFKFTVIVVTTGVMLKSAFVPLTELPTCGLRCVPDLVHALFLPMIVAAIVLFLTLGALDLALQRFVFLHEQRMTHSELKRERKDMHGDPKIKDAHRKERFAAMRSHVRMGVRNASLVIQGDNLAVAMSYGPPKVMVPVLVARASKDGVSALLAEAADAQIPCVVDEEAARLVTTRVQMGSPIPNELFQPVIRCLRVAKIL